VLLVLIACTQPELDSQEVELPPPQIRLERVLSLPSSALSETLAADYPWNRGPGLAAADLDADGWLDLVMSLPTENSLIFRNHQGVFGSPEPLLPSAVGVAAADLNGDGAAEVVLVGRRGRPDLLFRNDGTGILTKEVLPNSTGESRTPAFADMDNDGDLDLVISGFAGKEGGQNSLLIGDGHQLFRQDDGQFFDVTSHNLPSEVLGTLAHHINWADVDQDGAPDLIIVNDRLGINRVLHNDQTGVFTIVENSGMEQAMQAMGVAIGDPNADGFADMLVSDISTLRLWQGDGTGLFAEVTQAVELNPPALLAPTWGVAWVDLDLDGRPEAVAMAGNLIWSSQPVDSEQDRILRYTSDEWEDVSPPESGNSRAVAVGDFDRDGRPDLAMAGILFFDLWYNRTPVEPGCTVQLEAGYTQGIGTEVQPDEGSSQWLWPSTTYSSSAPELYLPPGHFRLRNGDLSAELLATSGTTVRLLLE
jgi:FG-GAP-like repeat